MTRHDLWRMSILGATPSMLRGNAADDYVVRSGNLRCLRSHVPDNILWKSDILNLKANSWLASAATDWMCECSLLLEIAV